MTPSPCDNLIDDLALYVIYQPAYMIDIQSLSHEDKSIEWCNVSHVEAS